MYEYDLYDLAHVAGWDPYDLPDLAQVSWVGSVYYADPAQPLTTVGEDELDHLDHYPSGMRNVLVSELQSGEIGAKVFTTCTPQRVSVYQLVGFTPMFKLDVDWISTSLAEPHLAHM